jgi:hypothetical protein
MGYGVCEGGAQTEKYIPWTLEREGKGGVRV